MLESTIASFRTTPGDHPPSIPGHLQETPPEGFDAETRLAPNRGSVSARSAVIAEARLLGLYESIVAMRPIGPGNHDYLLVMLQSCRRIARRLRVLSASAGPLASIARTLARQVELQEPGRAAEQAKHIVALIRGSRSLTSQAPPALVIPRCPAPLADSYERVTITFGPGLGMGDEVTYRLLVLQLQRYIHAARWTVYSLYPGLWRNLAPGLEDRHYRGRPHRPFLDVARAQGGSGTKRCLALFIDFDAYGLAQALVPRRLDLDVVETSLGLRAVWVRRGTSPWVDHERFGPDPLDNNYGHVHRVAERLAPQGGTSVWHPIRLGAALHTKQRNEKVILLNASSSKPVPIKDEKWRETFERVAAVTPNRTTRVVVYPGLHEESRGAATRLAGRLSGIGGIRADVLRSRSGGPIGPFDALDVLVRFLDCVDLCVTIDTFSAHLVPLYGLPTIVIALKDNRAFWVPCRHAFYCHIDNMASDVPARILRILRGARSDQCQMDAARALLNATERLLHDPSSPERVRAVLAALRRGLIPDRIPFEEGRRWEYFWRRFADALEREAVSASSLDVYVRRWVTSEYFKLATYGLEVYSPSESSCHEALHGVPAARSPS